MAPYPKILLFSNDAADIRTWEAVFDETAITCVARNLQQLQNCLAEDDPDVVFCGWSCGGGASTWHDVLARVQNTRPNLPVVIYSRTGGETEWIRVLEAGAFDLIAPPYQKRSVLPVLEQAIASHQARRLYPTGTG
jgi:DNA-binding NtrC family response regulator